MDARDAVQHLAHEITGQAQDEPGRFRAFLAALGAALSLPADGHVVGEPVEILGLDYSGHPRQGLTARCRRDEREYVVSLTDVTLPSTSPAARLVAAYHLWCGLEPVSQPPLPRPPKAVPEDVPGDRPVDLVVLALKQSAARCRLLGSDRQITLRSGDVWTLVPGDIVTVQPRKRWTHARHPYISGEVLGSRFAPGEIGLVPLRLEPRGGGPPPVFEMEEAIPGGDGLAILEAIGAREAGDVEHAREILEKLLERDLRCIAAREMLGSFVFRAVPWEALRYYESGVRVGDLSFSADFHGALPWSMPGNRPFLRCLRGHGLCLWRQKQFDEARRVLERLLVLDPEDHQGVRAASGAVERRQAWEEGARGLAND
jgi:hypothetical protein